jgi:hypothetical protein
MGTDWGKAFTVNVNRGGDVTGRSALDRILYPFTTEAQSDALIAALVERDRTMAEERAIRKGNSNAARHGDSFDPTGMGGE